MSGVSLISDISKWKTFDGTLFDTQVEAEKYSEDRKKKDAKNLRRRNKRQSNGSKPSGKYIRTPYHRQGMSLIMRKMKSKRKQEIKERNRNIKQEYATTSTAEQLRKYGIKHKSSLRQIVHDAERDIDARVDMYMSHNDIDNRLKWGMAPVTPPSSPRRSSTREVCRSPDGRFRSCTTLDASQVASWLQQPRVEGFVPREL